MNHRVFVARTLPEPGTAPLVAGGLDVRQHESAERSPTREELLAGVDGCDAVISLLTDRIDAEVMDRAGRLRVVANLAVGYDNVDLDAASARGVVVTNTPDVLTEATADLTWALLLAAARRIGEGERLVRAGAWEGWSPTQLLGPALPGKTLGVYGLGKIGTAVARRAQGFGMRVLYTNRRANPVAEAALGVQRVPFDELVAASDFVVVNAPLNEESRHRFGAAEFERMKPGAIIVNAGRGPIIDEAALVDALRRGVIAGAALDVYEREPQVEAGLLELDNAVLAPHLGSATHEARAAMVQLCCSNVLAVLSGRPALTPVA